MSDRIIRIILAGSSASAVRAFSEVGAASEMAQAKVEGVGGAAGLLKNPYVAAGAVIATVAVGIGAATTVMAAQYQESTSKMAAQAGITNAAAKGIGDAFLGTAFQSTFSAKQMMDAYGPVAGQLGATEGHALTAAQSLEVMTASTDLAEASGSDLKSTTAGLAAVMQAYKIHAGGAAGASDILFNSSRQLGAPVEDVATAVDKLKGKLQASAPSLADSAALMVGLKSAGMPAKQAVGAMSTAFTSMIAPTGAQAAAMADLHVKFTDAHGQFIGMHAAVDLLHDKFAALTPAQQLSTAQMLFGHAAAASMVTIIDKGSAAFDKQRDALSKVGSAHQGAKTATENLTGALDKAKAGIGTLGTKIGEFLLPIVTKIVQWFTDHMLPALKGVFDWVEQNWPTISKVFGVFGDIVGTYLTVVFNVWATAIGVVVNIIKTIVGAISAVIGSSVFQTVLHVVEKVFGTGAQAIGGIIGAVVTVIGAIAGVIGTAASAIGSVAGKIIGAFQAGFGWVKDHILQPIIDAINWIASHLGAASAAGKGVIANAQKQGGVAGAAAGVLNATKDYIPFGGLFATGGYLGPGKWGIAGENGPEPIYAGDTGLSIVPNRGSGGGGGGGSNHYYNINVSGADPKAVVQALKQYMQQSGALPLTVRKAQTTGA